MFPWPYLSLWFPPAPLGEWPQLSSRVSLTCLHVSWAARDLALASQWCVGWKACFHWNRAGFLFYCRPLCADLDADSVWAETESPSRAAGAHLMLHCSQISFSLNIQSATKTFFFLYTLISTTVCLHFPGWNGSSYWHIPEIVYLHCGIHHNILSRHNITI